LTTSPTSNSSTSTSFSNGANSLTSAASDEAADEANAIAAGEVDNMGNAVDVKAEGTGAEEEAAGTGAGAGGSSSRAFGGCMSISAVIASEVRPFATLSRKLPGVRDNALNIKKKPSERVSEERRQRTGLIVQT
jgi:hypothetical protein